jgi:anti-sigma B factor antagonist
MAAVDLGEFASSIAELAPSTHVATIAGDLDLYSADDLRDELAPLTQRENETLIVEMSGVTFVDSTALGVLTGAAKLLRARGGRLVLASGDPRFRRLLEITGLLAVLHHEPTLTKAIERFVDHASV